jgi:hypothetical protein
MDVAEVLPVRLRPWKRNRRDAYGRLQALVERIDLSNFGVPLQLTLMPTEPDRPPGRRPAPPACYLCLSMIVLDRVDRRPTRVRFSRPIDVTELLHLDRDQDFERHWLRVIYDHVHAGVAHEVDECFRLDGKLIFDPHAGDGT